VKVALDTNVVAYSEGVNTIERRRAALSVLRRIPRETIGLPVQVLGELFNVLVRKRGFTPSQSHAVVKAWSESVSLIATSPEVMANAIEVARDHHLGIWDAVILSAAAEGGCRLLLSEDMQDGFAWGGVTVANPFAATRHPLLAGLLSDRS
jgi:predicted nucleic acid-binding protein